MERHTNSSVVTAAAWSHRRGGCSVVERGDRIKPERSHRRTVQKLTWRESEWVKSFSDAESLQRMDGRVGSMTITDISPSVAIRRVLLLYENLQYREAANFINRLNHGAFKAILGDLPLDLFVESMPQSLTILEALYAKVFLSDDLNFSIKLLRPDTVVMQMVRMFAQHDEPCGSVRGEVNVVAAALKPVIGSCKKLIKVIVLTEPRMKKQLNGRKRSLDKAIEGMGRHGLVGTSDDTLMNLHEALKVEFERAIHQFKTAVQKLDELSLAPKQPVTRSVSYGPAPTDASHQRQLSLRQDEIQERLIKNKTLLNMIEPTLTNHSLEILLQILRKRVEFDKDVMFQFTQLRKEVKDVNQNAIVAPVLMRFSHGCVQVLDLMKEMGDDDGDDDSSDISGYHSDSDSAIALSGSSAYNGLAARRNHILYRSARVSGSSSGGSRSGGSRSGGSSPDTRSFDEKSERAHRLKFKKTNEVGLTRCTKTFVNGGSSDPWEVSQLRKEVELTQEELRKTRHLLIDSQDKERQMKERLAEQAQKMLERGIRFENISMGEKRPTALIRRYGNLYAQARVDTLDALDALQELRDGDELKSKLLFSVVVLAFRSIQGTIAEMKASIHRLLQIPNPADPASRELEFTFMSYLRDSVDRFDVRKNVEEVCSQIWATLYDYPCLKSCDGLIQYVRDCVRLAWGLCNQQPPFVIEYETRLFRRDMHVRFHASNQDSAEIKTYLWPALLEGHDGPCVHKGVVVT